MKRALGTSRDPYLVAVVGFSQPLSSSAKGILERCELALLECPTLDEACEVLRTLAPDAILLDAHHRHLRVLSQQLTELLQLVAEREGRFVPLVVLPSSAMSTEVVQAYRALHATFIPRDGQSFRAIASVVRRLCGLPEGCCDRSIAQNAL